MLVFMTTFRMSQPKRPDSIVTYVINVGEVVYESSFVDTGDRKIRVGEPIALRAGIFLRARIYVLELLNGGLDYVKLGGIFMDPELSI